MTVRAVRGLRGLPESDLRGLLIRGSRCLLIRGSRGMFCIVTVRAVRGLRGSKERRFARFARFARKSGSRGSRFVPMPVPKTGCIILFQNIWVRTAWSLYFLGGMVMGMNITARFPRLRSGGIPCLTLLV